MPYGGEALYTALYRKLRPVNFHDVVDQGHIVRTLTNQILHERIGHAYLFCGVRGTGKTSCAKIFARAVNCVSRAGAEACGVCVSCVDISLGRSMDVIEIDAASNNGVDNIRDLRDEVRYPPQGKYKVYIIDEVHMLSGGAFNALLKTLEEPPPQVIFILATTDPQKIPATIHSRLMRFDFHRISVAGMTDALRGYMDGEGISITEDALAYVVRIADGAMRDALSLLDRLAGMFFEQEITLADALEVTGSMSSDVFHDMYNALNSGSVTDVMRIIEDISAKGRDFAQFAEEFLGHLRDKMVDAAATGDKAALSGITAMVSHFAENLRKIKQSGRLHLEIACIEWSYKSNYQLSIINYQLPESAPSVPAAAPSAPSAPSSPSSLQAVAAGWVQFCQSEYPRAMGTDAGLLDDDVLYVVCANDITRAALEKDRDNLAKKLSARHDMAVKLEFVLTDVFNKKRDEKFGKDPALEQLKELINFPISVN